MFFNQHEKVFVKRNNIHKDLTFLYHCDGMENKTAVTVAEFPEKDQTLQNGKICHWTYFLV